MTLIVQKIRVLATSCYNICRIFIMIQICLLQSAHIELINCQFILWQCFFFLTGEFLQILNLVSCLDNSTFKKKNLQNLQIFKVLFHDNLCISEGNHLVKFWAQFDCGTQKTKDKRAGNPCWDFWDVLPIAHLAKRVVDHTPAAEFTIGIHPCFQTH